MRYLLIVLLLPAFTALKAQRWLEGELVHAETREPVPHAVIRDTASARQVLSNERGRFRLAYQPGAVLEIRALGFGTRYWVPGPKDYYAIELYPNRMELDPVVISGTLRPVKKLDSPVPVEVYTPQFLKKNPAPSLFESLQNINGVRPQLNCNVCNTGDIHINGLEGPYTLVTIDGMPIVSSLASVYGLFGIPSQLIERIEIVKGPASGLYGAEAIGGLINIITRKPENAPLLTLSAMTTSWAEHNLDLGFKFRTGNKSSSLLGINYFNYQRPADHNNDLFTDIALQHRISVFNKISWQRKENRTASLAGRFFYEDRWGGDMRWNRSFRGGDSLYGESIGTNRWELIGNYQLPIKEKMFFSFSATAHRQDSYYGTTAYKARQDILFGQLLWDKKAGPDHQFLSGLTTRVNYYDDNSTATMDTSTLQNKPERYGIPGIFVQDEWKLAKNQVLLLGLRYDHHPVHRGIVTPRMAWKWKLPAQQVLRLNAGTGFRVVSLFAEEHAALTGARVVDIQESLNPERSYNINLNYAVNRRWDRLTLNLDVSAWYSRFSNQIIPDYDTDPNKIIYRNLDGFSLSKGLTLNGELNLGNRIKALLGCTFQDVSKTENKTGTGSSKQRPMLTEKWSGTWAISFHYPGAGLSFDYTGNLYGPMRLPLVSADDPRPAYSPVWSLQNIQVTKLIRGRIELFGGIKNLLDWTPARSVPFLIARSHDPFDKKLEYETDGSIRKTAENPYGLSFDPAYVYAPNQGIRFFGGLRYTLKK